MSCTCVNFDGTPADSCIGTCKRRDEVNIDEKEVVEKLNEKLFISKRIREPNQELEYQFAKMSELINKHTQYLDKGIEGRFEAIVSMIKPLVYQISEIEMKRYKEGVRDGLLLAQDIYEED